MAKTAVITDSTSYIDRSKRQENNIFMIPLNVIFGSDSYREEIELKTSDFYNKMRNIEELPKTSQPAVGEFVELYERLGKEYNEIVVITLSSGISGTYQSALSAVDLAENVKVYVFDSEISCAAQGFYVLEASKMAQSGKSGEEIISRLNDIKRKGIKAYFMVDDLTNLKLGGRLSGAQAFFGGLLKIKPVLAFEDKVIQPFEKIRTRKKAIRRLFEIFDNDAKTGETIHAAVIHATCPDDAAEIKEELETKYRNATVEMGYFGPVIGTHLGEGAIGLTWYKP
ncbi:fatty acid-binding protein DegV [Pueribacillus theae]|uniref:Fatty acid-binding protein DegV n=1 Tax=Pueribacillus theae TaxID=2171751 RepID=A0A2U1K6P4_9BACI|nr:DegV family protein [Pueribacillus theae]PWA12633.1 fatty acid-binding protein DegV [Pueribacillus theae]